MNPLSILNRMSQSFIWINILILTITISNAQKITTMEDKIKVAIVINPYAGDRAGSEISNSPARMAEEGLIDRLGDLGVSVNQKSTVALSAEEEKEYGRWHRFGIASGHLGELVSGFARSGLPVIGLLNNCSSLVGMLAGLQHSGESAKPLRVGLVWIDAHADYNTPETTLSGMLGGMPVAIAAGDCLTRLRLQSGLDPALPDKYIVMAGVRDVDPLEQERLDNSFVEMITVEDIRNLSTNLHNQMKRLSELTDIIYVHVDMDVLDPEEVQGHPLTVPGGPSGEELSKAIKEMFRYTKTAAIGIASLPKEDKKNLSLEAAYSLIEGAMLGIKSR